MPKVRYMGAATHGHDWKKVCKNAKIELFWCSICGAIRTSYPHKNSGYYKHDYKYPYLIEIRSRSMSKTKHLE